MEPPQSRDGGDIIDVALPHRCLLTRSVFLLFGLLALRLILMAFVPVFDTSESRYAAISANMARTGDFVVPHFTYEGHYQSFDGKPPLVFQAGGVMCKAFGTESPVALQFAVRIFPLASAILLLMILFHGVKKFSNIETAWLAVLVCATATAFYAAAGICMTDMTLTCCVAGSLILYRCFAEARELRYAFGVATLLGAGMIVKGPVALVLFGLPVFVDACINRRWRAIFAWQWLAAAPLFLLVAVPWFVLVEERNPGAVLYFFYNENFLRFVKHDYGDKYGAGREAFRGVAILWALVATLPWSLVPVWGGVKRLVGAGDVRLKTREGGVRARDKNDETREDVRLKTRGSFVSGLKSSLVSCFSSHDPSFFTLSVVAITLFWCLTSRVLLYYLFPVIPLFAAALALKGNRMFLWKLVPWAAGISALVLTCGLVGGMLFSGKMRGAKAPETYGYDGYSHEFYHGTNPKCRTEKGVSIKEWGAERWLLWLKTPEGQLWLKRRADQQKAKEAGK